MKASKRANYAEMRKLGYDIKRRKNPLFGKVRGAEKYVRYWEKEGLIGCNVGEEGQFLFEKQSFKE